MDQKRSGMYFYLAVMFSIGVLAYSVYIIFNTVTTSGESPNESFYYNLILGLIGIGLSVSSLSTMRRRMQFVKAQAIKTFSVEFCEKCSYKKVRDFKVGDYVHKKIGACPQCAGDLQITSIYSVSPKE